jgi:hypothetical protein
MPSCSSMHSCSFRHLGRTAVRLQQDIATSTNRETSVGKATMRPTQSALSTLRVMGRGKWCWSHVVLPLRTRTTRAPSKASPALKVDERLASATGSRFQRSWAGIYLGGLRSLVSKITHDPTTCWVHVNGCRLHFHKRRDGGGDARLRG